MTPTPPTTRTKIIRAANIAIDVLFIASSLWLLDSFVTFSIDFMRTVFVGGSFNPTHAQASALLVLAVVGALSFATVLVRTLAGLAYRAGVFVCVNVVLPRIVALARARGPLSPKIEAKLTRVQKGFERESKRVDRYDARIRFPFFD